MKFYCTLLFLFFTWIAFSQKSNIPAPKKQKDTIATQDMYRFISLEKDTTYIDTSLSIQKEYTNNLLRRDNFGLLPFSNEGHTYNNLQFGLKSFSPYTAFGFKAKHFFYQEKNQIRYGSVATPITEFFYKSIIEKGQALDSYFSVNTSERLNFSIGYKGIRSTGAYNNQLASIGNFKFTLSYNTKNKRYFVNFHYTNQDISNEENGGITDITNFENGNVEFKTRTRFEVFLTDAKNILEGKRYFIDHNFKLFGLKKNNSLALTHQLNYESKFFEYNQKTVTSAANGNTIIRFGDAYKTTDIVDQSNFNSFFNRLGIRFENATLGQFHFFIEDFRMNHYYQKILILDNGTIPNRLKQNINAIGGKYNYERKNLKGDFLFSKSISTDNISNIEANLQYDYNNDYQLALQYQNISQLPDAIFNLYQSSFVSYNWYNEFKNENTNLFKLKASTPFVNLGVDYFIIKNHLYFKDVTTTAQSNNQQQIIAPAQFEGTINYFAVKLDKEFELGRFNLNNTFLYQSTTQNEKIINVPSFVIRNTLAYNNHYFDKALYLQTGVTFNYFTKYFGDNYNPVLGSFFVQNQKEFGDYSNFDFFVNAKIQRTRIYLKAEHFNASFSGNNYYAAPNNPYRDFHIRFGLVWNFFK